MNILVTGCYGQLGKELKKLAGSNIEHQWYFTDVDTLDITDPDAVERCFSERRIGVCINCAAYTAVDLAEDNPETAARVNTLAPQILANTCLKHKALLIHVSTDYVFDGNGNRPYQVTDPVNPQSVYGRTKAEGERLIHESGCNHIIVRTAWLYSSNGKNFVKTMLRLADERTEINVVDDQRGCPTWAHDLAHAIVLLMDHYGSEPVKETFHFTNEGNITWYDFACSIMEIAGKTCKVNPITTDQFPAKAHRPAYSVLDLSKVKQVTGMEIPSWRRSLAGCIEEIINKTE
jgi:dTDP-4-dehydrorhamnose reductase